MLNEPSSSSRQHHEHCQQQRRRTHFRVLGTTAVLIGILAFGPAWMSQSWTVASVDTPTTDTTNAANATVTNDTNSGPFPFVSTTMVLSASPSGATDCVPIAWLKARGSEDLLLSCAYDQAKLVATVGVCVERAWQSADPVSCRAVFWLLTAAGAFASLACVDVLLLSVFTASEASDAMEGRRMRRAGGTGVAKTWLLTYGTTLAASVCAGVFLLSAVATWAACHASLASRLVQQQLVSDPSAATLTVVYWSAVAVTLVLGLVCAVIVCALFGCCTAKCRRRCLLTVLFRHQMERTEQSEIMPWIWAAALVLVLFFGCGPFMYSFNEVQHLTYANNFEAQPVTWDIHGFLKYFCMPAAFCIGIFAIVIVLCSLSCGDRITTRNSFRAKLDALVQRAVRGDRQPLIDELLKIKERERFSRLPRDYQLGRQRGYFAFWSDGGCCSDGSSIEDQEVAEIRRRLQSQNREQFQVFVECDDQARLGDD